MTAHLHHLTGCAPAPLAHYLKALGILRIVAQQKDRDARGFWRDVHFCLVTSLDRPALERFFLEEYAPTPFLSPWNKGSGFYKADDPGLAPVERSTAQRFAPFRAGIAAARAPLTAITSADAEVRALRDRAKAKSGMTAAQKSHAAALKDDPTHRAALSAAEREFKRLKADLYGPFARTWRGGEREWLDAAMVLADDGRPTWPSLLGTGGNDGRLDFTNNAMQRIGELFDLTNPAGTPTPVAPPLLANSLWGIASRDLSVAAVGQYLPATAGGANGTSGPESDAQVNAWDFVLMLEGAIGFRGQATRRLAAGSRAHAAIPFAVHAHAVGHGTRGREGTERGEQWMPLWSRPASWADTQTLLCEGRATLGRANAARPLDFARAVARLGVARGVVGFVRFGFLERNGQSKIAVPLGRLQVGERANARLVDDMGTWLDRLQRLVRAGDAPARLAVVEADLADRTFAALTTPDDPVRWQAILTAVAAAESCQVSGTGFEIGPCPALTPGWLGAAADDSPEWRLAVALGSAAAEYHRGRPIDPVRAHCLPLGKPGRYATTAEKRLVNDPRVVVSGRDAISDLVALVERRLVEAAQRGERHLPLTAARGAGARSADLAALLLGTVDLERVLSLSRALMAMRWCDAVLPEVPGVRGSPRPDDAWVALRLCGLPFAIRQRRVPMELAIVRRLGSGDASGAVDLALRRLRAAGLRPPVVAGAADARTSRLWAAALAFPIAPAVADAMADRFENHATTEIP